MTRLVANSELNMSSYLEYASLAELFEFADVIIHTTTTFQIKDVEDTQEVLTLTGSFGGYTVDGYPTTGTITGGSYSPGNTQFGAFTFSGASMSVQDFTAYVNADDTYGLLAQLLGGADEVIGSDFNDALYGFGGNDTIDGGLGIDLLIGAGGADTLWGGGGADVLSGGDGADVLNGGLNNDTFVDTRAELNGDLISDFSAGDKILFTDATLSSFTFSVSGDTLTYSGGSLTFGGVLEGTLVASAGSNGGVQLTLGPPAHHAHNDFNGDGRSDLALHHTNGAVTDWLGQADGTFLSNHAAASYALPAGWQVSNTGDFNGDGRSDILLRDANGSITEWLGQANGGFDWNASATYGLGASWHVAATGDVNGDGRADLILVNDNGAVTDWLGQADGTFFSNHAAASYALPAGWSIAGSGDFNGDGRADAVLRNGDGSITEWLGQADGGFAWNPNATYSLAASWHLAGTGDFNGDGRDDLLLRNDNGSVTNWLGQADGTFFSNHAAASYALPAGWGIAEAGDFNGDRHTDVLLRHTDGTITQWLGQSDGGFAWNAAATYGLDTSWGI